MTAVATTTRPANLDDPADQLRSAVHGLGATVQAIGHTLKVCGCLGRPLDCDQCPVARYLERQLPGIVIVTDLNVAWMPPGAARWIETELPAQVTCFVRRFDAGFFPELEVKS